MILVLYECNGIPELLDGLDCTANALSLCIVPSCINQG